MLTIGVRLEFQQAEGKRNNGTDRGAVLAVVRAASRRSSRLHLVKVRDCLSVQLTRGDAERCIELALSIEAPALSLVHGLVSLVGTGNA